jgi:diphthine-ammonia ligase
MIGSAVVQTLQYRESSKDEVEDLYELLFSIKKTHPDIEGVSCGAIVSTYQRLRVENVCLRLKLTPLTYLWMRDRSSLLSEIIQKGVVAVIVKVAGSPKKLL